MSNQIKNNWRKYVHIIVIDTVYTFTAEGCREGMIHIEEGHSKGKNIVKVGDSYTIPASAKKVMV